MLVLPNLCNWLSYRRLCDYAKDQLRDYLMWEMDPKRARLPQVDNRIHVCLYLLSPHQRE